MGFVVRTKFDGYGADGLRSLCKGGGSSSGQVYYQNQDKLLGTQADIAQNMYNTYAAYAPSYLSNASSMVNEAMDGSLADRARATAGADADAATSSALAASNRSLERYGATLNPNAQASQAKTAALQGAATKAGAMNQAQQWAEDQKWNRNAGAYAQVSGMGSGAMQGIGSAASGYGGMGNSMTASSNAAAAGYGQTGGMLAALFKDGGIVCAKQRKFAVGGPVTMAPVHWQTQSTSSPADSSVSKSDAVLSVATPIAIKVGFDKVAKPALNQAWNAMKDTAAKGIGAARNYAEQAAGVDQTQAAADVVDKSTALADGTASAAGVSPAADAIGGVEAASLDGATGTLAGTAATDTAGASALDAGLAASVDSLPVASEIAGDAAGTAAAAGGLSATWVGIPIAAALLASQLFADGGETKSREDYRPGGAVDGPGTETSDDIPAWLSDGEIVENAEAAKLSKAETEAIVEAWGEDGGGARSLLLAINDAGRAKRYGADAPQSGQEAPKENGLFDGGQLGIALGAGAMAYNQVKQQQEQNKRWQDESQRADARLSLDQERNARDSALSAITLQQAQDKQAATKTVADLQKGYDAEQGFRSEVDSAGGVEPYLATKAINGEDIESLRPGVAKRYTDAIDPTSLYKMRLNQAYAYRATEPEKAVTLEKLAHQQAAGHALSALERGDMKAFSNLYSIFPNGDLPDSITAAGDNLVFKKGDQTSTVPRDHVIRSLQAFYDPDKAITNGNIADKIDAMEKNNAARMQNWRDLYDLKLAQAVGKANGVGAGKSSSKSGGAGGDGAVTLEDYKKVDSLLKEKTPDGNEASGYRINGEFGPFQPADVVQTARGIYALSGGALPKDDALMTAARYHAAQAIRPQLEAQLATASEKDAPAIKAKIEQLPKVGYQFDPTYGVTEVLHTTGLNASTQPIRRIDPSAGYDVANNPNLMAAIRNDANIGKLASAVYGDSGSVGQVSDDEKKARLQTYADDFAQKTVQAARDAGRSPQDLGAIDTRARMAVANMARWLPAYQQSVDAEAKARASAAKQAQNNTPQPRSAQDVATFGDEPVGIGAAIAAKASDVAKRVGDFTGGIHRKVAAAGDLDEFTTLNMMRKERNIDASGVARFKELLATHPEYAQRFGLDPQAFAVATR